MRIKKIRDYINQNHYYEKYFLNYKKNWNILCAAMDLIDDTQFAMDYFLIKRIPRSSATGLDMKK